MTNSINQATVNVTNVQPALDDLETRLRNEFGGDFWRSQPGNLQPDQTTDVSDAISRTGRTGIGDIPNATPVAKLDVAQLPRTGIDGRIADMSSYITGSLPVVRTTTDPATPTGGSEFLHSNQRYGVGIARDGLYMTGSDADLYMNFKAKGAAGFAHIYPAYAASRYYFDQFGIDAPVLGGQFLRRFYQAGAETAREYVVNDTLGPLSTRFQWSILGGSGTLIPDSLQLRPANAANRNSGNCELYLDANRVHNRKMTLWDGGAGDHVFMGLGAIGIGMTYQVASGGNNHLFYAAIDATSSGEAMRVGYRSGEGRVGINMPSNRDPVANLEINGGLITGIAASAAQRNASVLNDGITAGGTTVAQAGPTAPEAVLRLVREGLSGVSWAATAEWRIGKNNNSINTTSEVQFLLSNGATATPNFIADTYTTTMRTIATALTVNSATALKIGGGLWAAVSDQRMKTSIANYTNGLAWLQALQPRTFKYKTDFGFGSETYVGLVSQEAEAVAPSLIKTQTMTMTTAQAAHFSTGAGDVTFKTVDPTEMLYALRNAVVTLAATGGPVGPAGPAGAQGPAGPAGAPGAQGPAGATGAQGPVGPAGPAGADGIDGVDGADGAQGPAGPAGADGADFCAMTFGTTQTINTDVNDRPITGSVCSIQSYAGLSSNRKISGFVAQPSGTRIMVANVGSATIKLTSEDNNSIAANRMMLDGDYNLKPGLVMELVYNGTLSRWMRIV